MDPEPSGHKPPAVKSNAVLTPTASAPVPPMKTWAKLEFSSTHNRNVWNVNLAALPEEIYPIFPNYLNLSIADRLFVAKSEARNPEKNLFSLAERIDGDQCAHAFVPHMMKTPGLLVLITTHDPCMGASLLPEYMPASEVYKAYRCYLELYSFRRPMAEPPGNPAAASERFAAAHALLLERGYAIMTNLRASVVEILNTAAETAETAIDTELVERFASISYSAAVAEILSVEYALLVVLGISPERAVLGELLSIECLSPPATTVMSANDVDACLKECNRLASLLRFGVEHSTRPSSGMSMNYVVPEWFLRSQLKSVAAAIASKGAQ